MAWRILTLTKPCRICVKHKQLNWADTGGNIQNIPLEDISVIILENSQIQITSALLSELMDNGAVVFSCDSSHLPNGAMFPFHANSRYSEIATAQIESHLPLRKRLWQQIVSQKIKNQASVLKLCDNEVYKKINNLALGVDSGDSHNIEGIAARIYWDNLWNNFTRNNDNDIRNKALNYGYAILRGCVARNAVAAGLLPFYGIHHHNKLDNFCLVDDLIEPWRPFVDYIVMNMNFENDTDLTPQYKQNLISVLLYGCVFNGNTQSILNAMPLYTESVASCFINRDSKPLKLPELIKAPDIVNTEN